MTRTLSLFTFPTIPDLIPLSDKRIRPLTTVTLLTFWSFFNLSNRCAVTSPNCQLTHTHTKPPFPLLFKLFLTLLHSISLSRKNKPFKRNTDSIPSFFCNNQPFLAQAEKEKLNYEAARRMYEEGTVGFETTISFDEPHGQPPALGFGGHVMQGMGASTSTFMMTPTVTPALTTANSDSELENEEGAIAHARFRQMQMEGKPSFRA